MTTPMPDYGLTFESSQESNVVFLLKAEDYAKNFLKEQIAKPDYTHELDSSELWGIRKDGHFYLIDRHPDVYDLLENSIIFSMIDCIGVVIHTTGWAAPLNEDGSVEGAPSQHALRRRVALAACVTHQSVGSALSFADNAEDFVTDPGSATGTLAEALQTFWTKANSKF